jgi:HK97 gp10 family phage protein
VSASAGFSGAKEFRDALEAVVVAVDETTKAAVASAAHLVQAAAMQRAPVATGTLRRSLHVEGPKSEGAGAYSAQIGPSVIYARRVELGFSGPDALGRVYDQKAKPYLAPGLDSVQADIAALFERQWAAATSDKG